MSAQGALFRLGGIPVFLPPSGILGILVIAWLWGPALTDDEGTGRWIVAGAFAILLALATLVHEMSHALVARSLGFPVKAVVLHLLGGVTQYERVRKSPRAEALVAAAGPAATLAVAAASLLLAQALPSGSTAADVAWALAWANLIIGIYNALPGLPLDGGLVLRALVWWATGSERTGTQVAGWAGRGLALLTLLTPSLLVLVIPGFNPDVVTYIVCGLLAAMIYTGASAQMRSMDILASAAGLTAGGLARRAFPVDRDLPLAEAIRRATAAGAGALVVIDHDGRPVGLGQHDAIAAVPEAKRPWLAVSAVARPLDSQATIAADVEGDQLLAELTRRRLAELLVVDSAGMAYGVLLRSDVEAALRRGVRAQRR